MQIAIVHDYFVQMGGAERVAEELFRCNRDATVFATVALPDRLPELLRETTVHTSWMQHLPYHERFYRLYFMLYPLGVRALDLSGFDCVLSSSSGYAKGIRVPRHAVHICYCHTPMRWVWSYDKYTERETGMGRAVKWGIRQAIRFLQLWDLQASRQPDHFIANSKAVAERIMTCYGRIAEVIHPPINVNRFSLSSHQGEHYLVLSRLVAYKRIDLAVRACTLLGRKLIVAGNGPALDELKKIAGPTITFAGRVSDEEAVRLAGECRALIFPGEEDFGMTPLEVAAAGRPTIAFAAGGALETIVEGRTGVFFEQPTAESLAEAIERFERIPWSQRVLRSHAELFSIAVFQRRMEQFMQRVGAPVAVAKQGPRSSRETDAKLLRTA